MNLIDHESRIRKLEDIAAKIDKRFDKLESKMDSQYLWILGCIIILFIVTMTAFGGVTLHLAKLI